MEIKFVSKCKYATNLILKQTTYFRLVILVKTQVSDNLLTRNKQLLWNVCKGISELTI